jgi:hypothetical protein
MNLEKTTFYLSNYYYIDQKSKTSRSNSRSSFGAISNHNSHEEEIIIITEKKPSFSGSFQNIFEKLQNPKPVKDGNQRNSLGSPLDSFFRRSSAFEKNSSEKRKSFFGLLSSSNFRNSNSFTFTPIQNTDQINRNFLNSFTLEESEDEEEDQQENQKRQSFNNILDILQNNRRIKYFKKFSKIEFSTENVEFWEDVDKFKKIEDPNERIMEAERISNTYLNSDSENEISISSRICKFKIFFNLKSETIQRTID